MRGSGQPRLQHKPKGPKSHGLLHGHLNHLMLRCGGFHTEAFIKCRNVKGACVESWRREASGEAMGCCTFSSSLAIWSVPLRERREGGCKGCGHPPPSPPSPPFSFFVMVPGRTCGGGGGGAGRGRRGAEGLICILLPFAADSI